MKVREVKFPGHRLASNPEGRRRILAKDFARTDLAPERRHDPAAGLAHDHKLPDTVHSGLINNATRQHYSFNFLEIVKLNQVKVQAQETSL